jgi:hypothetical protein
MRLGSDLLSGQEAEAGTGSLQYAKRAINFFTIDLFFFKIAKKKIHV